MKFEYPLQFPPQQPRTKRQERARFSISSPYKAGNELLHELKLLGANNIIISSNLQTRQRGEGFYSNQSVEDTGIAVYFSLNGDNKVMACDRWDKVEHNIWALCLSVKAIRGLDRWGGSEFLDGLFTGFKALPVGSTVTLQEVNYFENINDQEELKKRYRELAREYHPDMPSGDIGKFKEMKSQYEKLLKSIN